MILRKSDYSSQIASSLFINERIVRRYLEELEEGRYIRLQRKQLALLLWYESLSSGKIGQAKPASGGGGRKNAYDRLANFVREGSGPSRCMAMANWPGLQDRNVKIEATAILWQMMLADVPYELAEKALCRVLINAKFWPTVAELREAIERLKPLEKSISPAEVA